MLTLEAQLSWTEGLWSLSSWLCQAHSWSLVGGSVAPSLGVWRLLLQFLYITAWWEEERLNFPVYTRAFFIQSQYWPVKQHPLSTKMLPMLGVMLPSFVEIHASSSSQVPWKAEDSAFCSLRPAVPLHHQALPCLVHIRDHHLMYWESRTVGGLMTVYQDWAFAISLWGEDNHCQLLWKQYCVSCLLTVKNYSCIWHLHCYPLFRDSSFTERKFCYLLLWAICRKISAEELSTMSKRSQNCLPNLFYLY